jgi:hypothetical protein
VQLPAASQVQYRPQYVQGHTHGQPHGGGYPGAAHGVAYPQQAYAAGPSPQYSQPGVFGQVAYVQGGGGGGGGYPGQAAAAVHAGGYPSQHAQPTYFYGQQQPQQAPAQGQQPGVFGQHVQQQPFR